MNLSFRSKNGSRLAWIVLCLFVLCRLTDAVGVGTRYPDERKTLVDEKTGLTITALTSSPHLDNKFYQTHPSWLADGRHIVFVSNRAGNLHLFAVDPETGVIVQLTEGVSVHHACLERRYPSFVTIQDRNIKRIDAAAILHDSADGSLKPAGAYETVIGIFPEYYELRDVPTLDANGEWIYQCARNIETDQWFLLKFNLKNGTCAEFLSPSFKPGHIQANPVVPGLVMYCHETGGDAPNRMWIVRSDGSGNQPFYREKESEWVTHENWWGMDRALFNLCDLKGRPQAIISVRYPDRKFFLHCKGPFWHVCGTPDQRTIVGDTFNGELYSIDTALGESRLLTQGHRPNDNVHAHQSISPDGRTVLFASGKLGGTNIMTVDIPLWSQLPK